MHFGRASELCHLSPSALTRSIQRLEAALNTSLFIRDTRQVQLTSAGEKFLSYAMKSQKEWEEICGELIDDASVEGKLSIYASVTAVYSVLPDLLEAYRASFPKVRLNLRTGAAEESLDALFAGDIDLAVAALPDRLSDRVDFLPLLTTELVFIAPRDAEFMNQYVVPDDIGKVPLVLPRSGVSRSRVDQCLRELGAHTARITEVQGNEGIIAMVRLGCGVGVVPQLVLDRSPFRDQVVVLSDAPKLDPYVVGLCATRKSLSRSSVSAMWDLVNAHALTN